MTTPRKTPANEPAGQVPRTAGPATARTVFSLSEEETFELGRITGRQLKSGDLVLLEGDLGAGKTVFARGIAVGLGVRPEDVSSPSFTLVQEYGGGRLPLFHVDLYRLGSPEELETLGLEELLTGGAVVLVEWGDKLPPYYVRDALSVRIHDVGEGSRRIELLSHADPSRARSADA